MVILLARHLHLTKCFNADKVVVGSFQGLIRIYEPHPPSFSPDHVILEKHLGLPVIHLAASQFVRYVTISIILFDAVVALGNIASSFILLFGAVVLICCTWQYCILIFYPFILLSWRRPMNLNQVSTCF